MAIRFFVSNGRIEGPASTANAFRLEGPLGSQDLAQSDSDQTPQVEVVSPTGEAAVAEAASTSGVPAATHSR